MEVVLVSVVLVSALYLLMVLPTSICLRAAEERGTDPLIGLFVGVLLSWVGVILFATSAGGRGRSFTAAQGRPVAPASELTITSDAGGAERREPVGARR
jgi:hypothetical protein